MTQIPVGIVAVIVRQGRDQVGLGARQAPSGLPCSFVSDGLCGEEGFHQQTVRGRATPVLCLERERAEVSPALPLREESQLPLFRAAWFIAASVPLLQPVWKGFHGCRPTASSQVFLSICCSSLLVSEF